MHDLQPEHRVVAAVLRLALRDAEASGTAATDARAFLAGGRDLELVCAVAGVAAVRVVRCAALTLGRAPR